jgi:hypothetical protein
LVRRVALVAARLLVSRCALVCSQWSRLVPSRVCVASARSAFLVHSRSRHPFPRIGLTFTRPPQRRVGRRSLVISSTEPVQSRWSALVARTACVCLCLPRGQNGTSCRSVALVAARKVVTSPQLELARHSFGCFSSVVPETCGRPSEALRCVTRSWPDAQFPGSLPSFSGLQHSELPGSLTLLLGFLVAGSLSGLQIHLLG